MICKKIRKLNYKLVRKIIINILAVLAFSVVLICLLISSHFFKAIYARTCSHDTDYAA